MDATTWLGRGAESVAHGVARAKYRVLLPKVGSAGRKQHEEVEKRTSLRRSAPRSAPLYTCARPAKPYLVPEMRDVRKEQRDDAER